MSQSGRAWGRVARGPACLLAAAGLSSMGAAQTFEWRGGGPSNDWRWPQNWEPNGVPGVSPQGASVTIPVGGATIICGSSVVLNSLTVEGSSSLPMPRLSIGSLHFELTVGSLKDVALDNARFIVNGPVSLDGQSSVVESTFEGPGETATVSGTLTVGRTTWDGIDFRNLAAVNMWLGVSLVNGATVHNSGRWEITGSSANGAMGPLGGGGRFVNSGQLVYNASVGPPGSGSISSILDNNGTITAQVGYFDSNGGGNHSGGSWIVQPTGNLRLRGQANSPLEVTGNVTASGAGVLRIGSNFSVEKGGRLTNTGLCFIEGDIACEGELRNTAAMTWSNGTVAAPAGIGFVNDAGGTLVINGGALGTTLSVKGVVRQQGPFTINNFFTGEVRIERGGEWLNIDRDIVPSAFPPEGSIRCEGTFRKPAEKNARVSVISVPMVLAGGVLRVDASRIILRAGGNTEGADNTIAVANGAEFYLTGGEFHVAAGGMFGDELSFSGAGLVRLNGSHHLTGSNFAHVTNSLGSQGLGLLVFDTCEVDVELRNSGLLDWRSGRVGEDLVNSRTVLLSGTATQSAGVLLNEQTVTQTGTLDLTGAARVANEGEWELTGPTSVRNFGTREFANRGLLLRTGSSSSFISGRFDVAGGESVVEVRSGSLTIQGPITGVNGNSLDEGTWIVRAGAALFTSGVTINAIGANAGVTLEGTPAERWRSLENLRDNNGRFTIRGQGQTATLPGGLSNTGTLSAEEGAVLRTQGPLQSSALAFTDHVAGGAEGPAEGGFICPLMINAGTMRPGGGAAPGPFRLVGGLELTPTGRVEVELGGLTPYLGHDRVEVSGRASLDGTLVVRILGVFVPEEGQSFEVVCAGSLEGGFAAIDAPLLPHGMVLTPVYTAACLTLRVERPCYADCDFSTGRGTLDIFDFLCFQNAYDAAETYACGCDTSTGLGVCDIFDFLCFQNAYAGGCP